MPSVLVIALTLMVLGGLIAAFNWLYVYLTLYTGRFHSSVPLIGGVLLCVGMLLLPVTRPYPWAAVLLDFGTIGSVLALPHLVRDSWNTSRFNLLEEYTRRFGIKTVQLRLFRKRIFTIEQSIRRGEHGLAGAGSSGEWEREGDRLILRLDGESAVFEPSSGIGSDSLRQRLGFSRYEGTDFSLAGIDLRLKYKRNR
jgi:hypothetical protein